MTYVGVANSGELLFSTNDEGLFRFGELVGDVSGPQHATLVTAIRGTTVSTGTPSVGEALVYNGAEYVPSGIGGGSHNLLSSTHSDTVANTATRGSIIYGNATPAWDELVLGSTGFVLYSDGTDLAYTQLGSVTPFSLGAEATPSVTFVGDTDTGWSAENPNQMIGSASGVGYLVINGDQQAVDIDGGQIVRTNAQGVGYTVLDRDYVIAVTAAPVTITLMATPVEGRVVVVKDRDGNASGGSPITIAGNGNNIDGNTQIQIRNSYGSFTLLYSGTEWNVI